MLQGRRGRGRGAGRARPDPAAPLAAPAEPLHFVGWQYNPQIVAENVDIFKKLYDENVEYELVPGEYHAVAETKLIAGQHIDMMYSEEDRLVRWNRAGWTRDVEGLPGHRGDQGRMYEVNVHNMALPDGKLGGLPYYTGFNSFVCNQKHLDAAGIEPPATWDELIEQCRKLKTGRGLRVPLHQRPGRGSGRACPGACSRSGTPKAPRSSTTTTTRRSTTPSARCWSMHRTLYEEELVVPDIFTLQSEAVPNFATGQHTYMVVHEYDQKVFNTPDMSQIAGACTQRDHAGRHALDLHLDRALPDGRRSGRRASAPGT